MRKVMALAAVVALGGCAGVGAGGFAHKGGAILDAEPLPMLSGFEDYDYDDGEEGEPFMKFGARGGLVLYGGASGVDATGAEKKNPKPRLTVGGYGRMLESEAGRVEVSVDIIPDIANLDRSNLDFAFGADYVGFINDLLYWKAGGLGILEMQGTKVFFIMAIEGGVGMWFPVGGEEEEESSTAVVVNFMLQLPVGVAGGVSTSKAYFAITGGYEF